MADDWRMTIAGLQRAQRRNLALLRALRVGSVAGESVRHAAAVAHRGSAIRTHVITGTLRASHRVYFEERGSNARAIITPDPGARNPLTGQRPAVYGLYEHRRGGSHAFYRRTVVEDANAICRAAVGGAFVAVRRTRV